MQVFGLRTRTILNYRILDVGIGPTQKFRYHHTGYLDEGPCNMGESQHEPAIEIGKA
jgi:hypothetical protein